MKTNIISVLSFFTLLLICNVGFSQTTPKGNVNQKVNTMDNKAYPVKVVEKKKTPNFGKHTVIRQGDTNYYKCTTCNSCEAFEIAAYDFKFSKCKVTNKGYKAYLEPR